MKRISILVLSFLILGVAVAQTGRPVLDIMLTNYQYPFPVSFLNLKSQGQDLKMAYMDVRPEKPNGKTVVLLHGKNFNGAYWKQTIQALDEAIREKLGQYQLLGKETQQKIPGAQLVELENAGHLPHIEVFERFKGPLKRFLK